MFFDFDGVVIDSEPIHFRAFRDVLAPLGLPLSWEDYCKDYLGYDDRAAFLAIARDRGQTLSPDQLARLGEEKTALVQHLLANSCQPMPGILSLIRSAAAAGIPMAVCSGALRAEIELPCGHLDILQHFPVIVSAQDVSACKPDPEGYSMACRLLGRHVGRALRPARCVVVEDSPLGIQAGKGAGMKVLAAATSYPLEKLSQADLAVPDFTAVSLQQLYALV